MSGLPAEEWRMFKDCPQSELELCWWYEYSRESCREVPSQPELFPQNHLYSEWPQQPYLSISSRDREARLIRLGHGAVDQLRSKNLMPPFRTYILPEMAKRYLDLFEVSELSEDGTRLGPRHAWPVLEISPACWTVLFRIDWRRSDLEMSADFAAWLKIHRPKDFPSPIGDRGAGNYSRRVQAELKALGAFRLLRFYGSWQDIPAEAAIYEKPDSWMTAHKKAKERLNFFQLWELPG